MYETNLNLGSILYILNVYTCTIHSLPVDLVSCLFSKNLNLNKFIVMIILLFFRRYSSPMPRFVLTSSRFMFDMVLC